MKVAQKTFANNVALYILLFLCSSKWIFEAVLGQPILEPAVLLVGVTLLLLARTPPKVNKGACIWIPYVLAIVSSLLLHGSNFGTWGRAALVIFTMMYVFMLNTKDFSVAKILRFIAKIGVFHALLVLIHFFMKQRFNSLVFPLYTTGTREYAEAYYRGGRYFGIMPTPHEVAGLISFSLLILLMYLLAFQRKSVKAYLLIALLSVALLLTGKRGVLVCILLTIVLITLCLYGSKKQWQRAIGFLLMAGIGLLAAYCYIITHPENALFYRIIKTINGLSSGSAIDSSRGLLYQKAFEEWLQNPWFGIGWRHFKSLTTLKFGFAMAHEVNFDYLQWLCELGIVGFSLMMTPVLITLYRTIFICRKGLRRITDPAYRWMTLFAISVQFFTLMYAFIEIPFYDLMYFTIYCISCLLINACYTAVKNTSSKQLYSRIGR